MHWTPDWKIGLRLSAALCHVLWQNALLSVSLFSLLSGGFWQILGAALAYRNAWGYIYRLAFCPGGGGNLIPGMLVVSHKGVNYAVWSRSGQDANTFAPLPRHHASKTGALMSLTCLQDAGKSADEDWTDWKKYVTHFNMLTKTIETSKHELVAHARASD